MASRERKRAERRKRKERSSERRAEQAGEARGDGGPHRGQERGRARGSSSRCAEGERPTVVTVGAVISALIAISSVVGYLAGVEVTRIGSDGIEQGEHAAPILSVIAAVALMGTMAYGMWRARYWAVLGFQALLVIVLVAASLGLVQATAWLQAVGTTLLIVGAGGALLLHDQGDGADPDAASGRAPDASTRTSGVL